MELFRRAARLTGGQESILPPANPPEGKNEIPFVTPCRLIVFLREHSAPGSGATILQSAAGGTAVTFVTSSTTGRQPETVTG
ncbi:MAG: hypothetical protein GZ090_05200 [Oxalobacteraceae bacterium]|nr:hypothetical protein [Oxalobacteraceae bacterium]